MTSELPVLTYHAIGDAASPLAVRAAVFAETMTTLARCGWRTLNDQQVVDGLAQGGWPDDSFVVHFDDGFDSVRQHAWPVLRDCAFTATVFVVVDWVGRDNDWPGQPRDVPRWPLMTWTDLEALLAGGVSLGAHTLSHPSLPTLSLPEQERQIAESARVLTQVTGQRSCPFAYPYGAFDRDTIRVAAQHSLAAYGTTLSSIALHDLVTTLPRIDAYYLAGGAQATRLRQPGMRAYLAARRVGRVVRRAFRKTTV